LIKYSGESHKSLNIHVRAYVVSVHQHSHSQMVTSLVSRTVDDVLVKVKPSLHRAFLHVVDVVNLCFTNA